MTMLYLFLPLFASSLLLVTPFVIEKEQIRDSEEPPFIKVNQTTSESPDPSTIEVPGSNVEFPFEEAEHDVDTCRKVSMYVRFTEIGLGDEIISPRGFDAFQCEGSCSSAQRKKFPNRLALMALLKKQKGINGAACCVPTKLAPISALVIEKNNHVALKKFDNMVVEECGCE